VGLQSACVRVLILSDIHGNAAALEAVVREPHDVVVCLGDVVGYGPEPGTTARWIVQHSEVTVQGNHDRALAAGVPPRCRPSFEWLAAALAPLGRSQLRQDEIRGLGGFPLTAQRTYDGVRCLFVHATPSDPLYRYLGPDLEEWAAEVAGLDADLVLVGHTHLQFDLDCGGTRVINPGSVGQPKDGDPRAAYAVLDDGVLRLKRAAYDIERTVAALERSGVGAEAVRDLTQLLRTGRNPPPRPPP